MLYFTQKLLRKFRNFINLTICTLSSLLQIRKMKRKSFHLLQKDKDVSIISFYQTVERTWMSITASGVSFSKLKIYPFHDSTIFFWSSVFKLREEKMQNYSIQRCLKGCILWIYFVRHICFMRCRSIVMCWVLIPPHVRSSKCCI